MSPYGHFYFGGLSVGLYSQSIGSVQKTIYHLDFVQSPTTTACMVPRLVAAVGMVPRNAFVAKRVDLHPLPDTIITARRICQLDGAPPIPIPELGTGTAQSPIVVDVPGVSRSQPIILDHPEVSEDDLPLGDLACPICTSAMWLPFA